MLRLTRYVLGSAVFLMVSCNQYKGKNLGGGTPTGATTPTDVQQTSDGTGTVAPGEKEPGTMEAKTPTEAQKDLKNFLALTDEEALHGLKEGEEQIKIVCDRNAGKTNKFLTAFCVNKVRPKSLIEFQTALGLAFPANAPAGRGNNGAGGNPGYAVQGHSSSLVGKFVSAINPRVIIFDPTGTRDIVIGFVRGEQLSEIAVKNTDNTFDFFIVAFKQACNAAPEGCTPGELLTPAVEKDWTAFTIYQDEDLKNSIVDCRQCHQPDGPGTPKILRMQELVNPWTHWFRDNTDGQGLATDYTAAHGTAEVYGGIPGNLIGTAATGSDPAKLEQFVRQNGFVDPTLKTTNNNPSQPNQFDTAGIRTQVAAAQRPAAVAFLGGAACPIDGSVASPSKSQTWDGLLYNFMNRTNACLLASQAVTAGSVPVAKKNVIPPPYHDLRVTDPAMLAKFTKQYQDFNAGTVTVKTLEDHRNAFVASQKEMAEAGFAVDPAMAPADIVKLACTQCHHADLDQTVSRSKFNIDFAKMTNLNAELDVAIARVKLGYSPERLKAEGIKITLASGAAAPEMEKGEHLLTMPPRRFRQLTDVQIDAVVKYLESQKKP